MSPTEYPSATFYPTLFPDSVPNASPTENATALPTEHPIYYDTTPPVHCGTFQLGATNCRMTPNRYFFLSVFSFIRTLMIFATFISTGYFVYLCIAKRFIRAETQQSAQREQNQTNDDGIGNGVELERTGTYTLSAADISLRRRALMIMLKIDVYSESFIENLREKEKDEGSEIKSGFALYLNRISGDEDNEINSECVICLDKYENGEDIISSPNCSHIFHKECLLEWLVYKDVCPCCRAQIVNPEELKTCMELVLEDGDA
mmetsp:Transcript_24471/g.55882  ORF Transcript_24471/g.55882 Transcript_24471/m.55882 type:complete len:261 (-) Transcript_24471:488-1270(-)